MRPADALFIDNGKGEGHIMLYINSDEKNSDNLNVYEQNISTTTPYEPIPVAREDIRSKRLPTCPIWLISLIIVGVIVGISFLNVRAFSRIEEILSFIKVGFLLVIIASGVTILYPPFDPIK